MQLLHTRFLLCDWYCCYLLSLVLFIYYELSLLIYLIEHVISSHCTYDLAITVVYKIKLF